MPIHPKKLLEAHGLRAKKSLGQNFLVDEHHARRIVEAAEVESGDTVVEVGPGLGAITSILCECSKRVIAIELDDTLAGLLAEGLGEPANLTVVHADARDVDLAPYAPARLVGNLPYYVSSPLVRWATAQHEHLVNATLTLQREVAERIAAGAGSRVYGALSAIVGLWAERRIAFRIPAGAFFPQPDVESAILQLTFLDGPRAPVRSMEHYERVVFAAFSKRRKTLSNSLKSTGQWDVGEIEAALDAAKIDGRRRAETLEVEELAALSRQLK